MIKQGFFNYLKSLRYVFVPLGCIALGAILGISVLIPGVIEAVKVLINGVAKALEGVSFDFSETIKVLFKEIQEIDWSNFFDGIKTMFSSSWLIDTLGKCITATFGDTSAITEEIKVLIADCLSQIFVYIVLCALLVIIGVFSGYLFTRVFVRSDTVKRRKAWKAVLAALADSTITILLLALVFYLATLWAPSIFVSLYIILLLNGLNSLMQGYLVHAYKVIEFKKIFNIKNIVCLVAVNTGIYASTILVSFLFFLITNVVVGVYICIAFLTVGFVVAGLNAEGYVSGLIPEKASE